jgi:hypothetical protein
MWSIPSPAMNSARSSDQAIHGEPHRRAPLAVHLRTWATVHASICELSPRRGGRACRVAASTSAHAAALLRLLARQRRLRPAPDPRLPWASRSQAHRSLHTRRRRTLRGALALSPGVFALKATKLLPFWSVGHFYPNGTVTLEVTFNAPTGLIAQEIVDSWGTMHLSVTYDGATYKVPISEKMIRALYESFRPNPIDPTVMRATPKIPEWPGCDLCLSHSGPRADRQAAIRRNGDGSRRWWRQ